MLIVSMVTIFFPPDILFFIRSAFCSVLVTLVQSLEDCHFEDLRKMTFALDLSIIAFAIAMAVKTPSKLKNHLTKIHYGTKRGHLYKPFWTKKIERVGRGGQGRSKYCSKWALFLASEPFRGP